MRYAESSWETFLNYAITFSVGTNKKNHDDDNFIGNKVIYTNDFRVLYEDQVEGSCFKQYAIASHGCDTLIFSTQFCSSII